MALLIAFSFLAGIVTVLSPCILPILPIVLSNSTAKDPRHPWGVVIGFISSFTFFTLFLSSIVTATGISADSLRFLSIIILAGFGASLLIPKFQVIFEQLFARLSRFAPSSSSKSTGLLGGLTIGLSLGLLWTPCVGPILASVISLALSGEVTGSAVIITLAYATGTAIPMLAIMRGGQALLQRHKWLLRNTQKIQKAFGVLMILTAIGIANNVDRNFQTYILETFPNYSENLTRFENNELVKKSLNRLN